MPDLQRMNSILNAIPGIHDGEDPLTIDEIGAAVGLNYHTAYHAVKYLEKENKVYLAPRRKGRKDAFYKIEFFGMPKLDRITDNPMDETKETIWQQAGADFSNLDNLGLFYRSVCRAPFRALRSFEWEDGYKDYSNNHESYRTILIRLRVVLTHMLKNVVILLENDPFMDKNDFKAKMYVDRDIDMGYVTHVLRSTNEEEKNLSYAQWLKKQETDKNDE